ncbi:shikimate dehydrogenase [Saccharopolyspora sp. HNM0983]|uniref:Quinate/shikimate dehydrogenase (NAD(+)) n=1 Tax=Saccharopolyspora montiporae TaxID=2781240 RepID=A0A929FWL6_9PSEU|nr:shikimate dehydrogenase [Saccharopolyspora sp. HNM0983]MBE9373671.1 shikimate dehydrogenase [Saccharopolyspora sp. HNM0983]
MTDTIATPRHRVALVGAGITGSLSPALHEREAAALGLDYTYALLDLDELPDGWTLREAAGLTGFNITHPAKQVVLDQLDDLSPDARALGAVNAVTAHAGRLIGHNTDHSGFITAWRASLPGAVLGRAVVVGAGGVGSAVAYALARAGAHVQVVDAETDRAAALVTRLRAAVPDAQIDAADPDRLPAALARADGVVNATPIGMTGHPGLPFDPAALTTEHWVADVVYRPRETALLRAARAAGCRVADGVAMLVAQAAESLALFAGTTPDLDRMRRHGAALLTAAENTE